MTELSIVLKTTAVLAAGLIVARMAHRCSAALRHLVLSSTFGVLFALPLAIALMPARDIGVPIIRVTDGRSGRQQALPSETSARPAPAPVVQSPLTIDPWIPAWPSILRVVWAIGAALVLASFIGGLVRVARNRRCGLPWLTMRDAVRRLAHDAGLDRPVDIVLQEQCGAPYTCGLRHPTIVMPFDATAWNEADLRRAFIHELEHVRRGDWATQLVGRAVCALYWFNPLVWVAWRRLRLEAERACDDAVIRSSDGAAYAEQLVELARRMKNSEASVLAMAGRSDLSARVSALLDVTQSRRRAGDRSLAVAVTAVFVVVSGIGPMRAVAVPARAAVVESGQSQARTKTERPGRQDRELFRAAARGDLTRIRELVDSGADVNAALDGDGSPLIAASASGRTSAVRLLLDRGADPNLAVEGDGSALIAAAREGHAEIVTLLLDRGAQIELVVPGDENALIQASGRGQLPVVKLLIERGANVNARVFADGSGARAEGEWRTPIGMARRGGHAAVVNALLAAGARE